MSLDPNQVQITPSEASYAVPPASVDQSNGNKDIAQQKTVEIPPVSESRRGLPGRYLYVITHPSSKAFEVEGSRAKWGSVFAQILVYALIMVVLGLLTSQLLHAILGNIVTFIDGFPGLSAFTFSTSSGAALLNLVYVPLFFFIGVLIQYAFARAFLAFLRLDDFFCLRESLRCSFFNRFSAFLK